MAPAHDPGEPLDAGSFGDWLVAIEEARAGRADAEVPCGTCTACCSASQFIPVGPDEADALAHIPQALLFPAPRSPEGVQLLGYDEQGRCPMLREGGCSIYEHRPRACRTYDCRIFAAAEVDPDGEGDTTKSAIAARARRWRFRHDGPDDAAEHAAVRAAAAWVRARREDLPAEIRPTTPAHVAIFALDARAGFAAAAGAVTAADVVVTLRSGSADDHEA